MHNIKTLNTATEAELKASADALRELLDEANEVGDTRLAAAWLSDLKAVKQALARRSA